MPDQKPVIFKKLDGVNKVTVYRNEPEPKEFLGTILTGSRPEFIPVKNLTESEITAITNYIHINV